MVLVFDSCLLKSDSVEALRKQGCTDANNGLFWLARSCPCRAAAWARGRARRPLSGRPLRLPAGKRNESTKGTSLAGDSDVCRDPRSNFQHTSDNELVMVGVARAQESGIFSQKTVIDWEKKPKMDKMWDNPTKHFTEE